LTGREAVEHLFSVTASLDSLVIGENQIAKQVKEAFQLASAVSASGPYLNRLFNRALFVAKRVRSETAIGKGNVSVGSTGIALAKKIFGTLAAKKVVLFGAGEVGELVLHHLKETSDVAEPAIVNRSPDKAHALAAQGLGRAHALDEFSELLMNTDILITSVSGDSEHLDKKAIEALMRRRRHRPIFIIDLGLPRNVDAAVGLLANVYLYNIDDLKVVANESRLAREDEIVTAKNIIDEETRLFYDSYLGQTALPMIAGLNRKFEDIRRREMERTLSRLAHLSTDDKNALDDMTRAIVARILHDPILHLKTKAGVDSPVLGVLKKIFRLDDEVDDE
jgi:glutamyl-tRNA reductase